MIFSRLGASGGFGHLGSQAGGGLPGWVVNRANPPNLDFNFAINQAWNSSGKLLTTASSLLTVSRASTGYVNDSNGNWTSVASNLPRISNLGLLVEEARTNSIRNNSMTGAMVMADNVELLTNGNFASAGTGWTQNVNGGNVVFSAGSVVITGNGVAASDNYVSQQITGLVIGRSYVISVAANSGSLLAFVGSSAGNTAYLGFTLLNGNGNGTVNPDRTVFTASTTSAWVNVGKTVAAPTTITQISVQDGERVQNGGFTSNPINASQSTVQNGWQWTNNVGTGTVVYNGAGSGVTITGDGTHAAGLDAAIPTVSGVTYTITVDLSGTTASIAAGNSAFNAALLNLNPTAGNGQKFQFTATASTTHISFAKTAAASFTVNNVSVQSAGATPTNWGMGGDSQTVSVAGIGTSQGIDYIDLSFNGTGTSGFFTIFPDGNPAPNAATYGQTWSSSVFIARTAGSNPAGTSNLNLNFREWISGSTLASHAGPDFSLTITSALTRQTYSFTLNQPTTNQVGAYLAINYNVGAAMNFTLRIGWPQLENNATINSTVASAVTAASGASGVNGTAVYSVGGGTGTGATLNCTWAAGVLTVNSVASAGSYTVFPPSPAALTYVSGTASGWTGATVTLTPTNNAASAFQTSPIRTTVAAATRAADIVTMTTPPTFGAAYSLYTRVTPQAPTAYVVNQIALMTDDGTATNAVSIYRASSSNNMTVNDRVASTFQTVPTTAGSIAPNVSGKTALAITAGDAAHAVGGAITTAAPASIPASVSSVNIGARPSSDSFWNGFIAEAAIWSSQRVPNAQLQSITT